MKACLIFQRRFTPVAHKIAKELKRKYGIKEFCGYVYLRTGYDFLKKQKDINYSALILDEEIQKQYKNTKIDWGYLNKIEKEYGIPYLWPFLSVDRIIRYGMGIREYPYDTPPYSHEEMAVMLQLTAKTIIDFLDAEKPDFIFLPTVSAMGNFLIYHIAKKKGIKVLVGAETRIGQGYILSQDYKNFSYAEELFKKQYQKTDATEPKQITEAKKYISEFRNKPEPYLYVMGSLKNSGRWQNIARIFNPLRIFLSIKWLGTLFVRNMFVKKQKDYTDESILAFTIDRVKRKIRTLWGFNNFWEKYDEKENFAYYALHFEPELAILALAPYWTDQLNLIKQISQSLPISFKLYVKEHPAMIGFRPRQYYKELKKIPNVKLIHPNFDSYRIIKDSKIVYTITGTAGWEALMFKKPVITFGDVFYNALSMSKKCLEVAQLPYMTKQMLENFKYDEIELEYFISALMEESAEVKLHEIWEKGIEPKAEVEKISLFCDLLADKLNLKSL